MTKSGMRLLVDKFNILHKSLMIGCKDDLEFCLKLYTAWAEAEWNGRSFAPEWAIEREWLSRILKTIPSNFKDSLGNNFDDFISDVVTVRNIEDIDKLEEQFQLGNSGKAWIISARNIFRNGQRIAWGQAYFINQSLLREKVDKERDLLLNSLSGHKKEIERRPIDFSRLDRVRVLMAACLPNRTYVLNPNAQSTPVEFTQKIRRRENNFISPLGLHYGNRTE